SHPAFSGVSDNVVVFVREGGSEPNARLYFRPVPTFGSSASTELPAVLNPDGFDELDPTFTADGRYLGFLRYDHHSETRHMRLFGRRVPRLVTVGRVPFGQFKRGRHKVRWNFRVNGRRLRRGRYLLTPRLLTRRGVVHELGKPHLLRIR